jgi:hypothetical protein
VGASRITLLCLGVGVDALNYVGDVLIAAVVDADLFAVPDPTASVVRGVDGDHGDGGSRRPSGDSTARTNGGCSGSSACRR